MKKILVSACLLGENVRYDGKNSLIDSKTLTLLKQKYILVPFCPEVEGGLLTPRSPSEIVNGVGEDVINQKAKLFNSQNQETTKEFLKGAFLALEKVKNEGIKIAILKSKSPSCSNNFVYDGTFSKNLIVGDGVSCALLKQEGVRVYNELEIKKLLN